MIRSVKTAVFLLVVGGALVCGAPNSWAVNLLPDPSFEDPVELDEVGSFWTDVYGSFPTPTVNQTSNPLSGLQHGELILDTAQLFGDFGPTMRSTIYAGSGATADIVDFTGMSFSINSHYKVTAFNMSSPDPEVPPDFALRVYLAYFSDGDFLGLGGIEGDPLVSDAYPQGVMSEYLPISYTTTVPDFGFPVTSIDFTIGVVTRRTDSHQLMTGTATVAVDDVSLEFAASADADFNDDNIVDAADYTVWRNSVGMTGLSPFELGDADGDSIVGPLDYDIWKEQYGDVIPEEAGSGAIAFGVPEPGSLMILLAGMLCTLSIRGNRSLPSAV